MARKRAGSSLKSFVGGVVVGLVVGAVVVTLLFTYNPPDQREGDEVDAAILMEEIAQISELATAEQSYTVAEKVSSSNTLFDLVDIPFTEKFFILTYTGSVKAGVNLDDASIAVEGTTVRVTLPPAQILSDAIDTESFKTLHEQEGLFNPLHVDDVTQYLDKTRQEAEAAALAGDVLAEAQANAEESVRALLGAALPEGYAIEFEIEGTAE
ncbi:DUF4230 domain-containing protein [Enterorhabdus sp. P55]|uniref:DUF4230 domain-containing protein n=1 Tax=Enterorhabdus sp. P55 TaxID=2304571 RepID=UPI001367F9E7|nr:DUF4230 domain-containing protein [Enterorhabdus sp. P55]NBI32791.1 DUF4230 domain-containing protein [Enterorhabdus sp. P55]